jgi:hypothetical protein
MCLDGHDIRLTQPNHQFVQKHKRLVYIEGRHTYVDKIVRIFYGIYIYVYIYIYIYMHLVVYGLSNRDKVIYFDFYLGLYVLKNT